MSRTPEHDNRAELWAKGLNDDIDHAEAYVRSIDADQAMAEALREAFLAGMSHEREAMAELVEDAKRTHPNGSTCAHGQHGEFDCIECYKASLVPSLEWRPIDEAPKEDRTPMLFDVSEDGRFEAVVGCWLRGMWMGPWGPIRPLRFREITP